MRRHVPAGIHPLYIEGREAVTRIADNGIRPGKISPDNIFIKSCHKTVYYKNLSNKVDRIDKTV